MEKIVVKKPWQSRTMAINFILAILTAIAFILPQAAAVSTWIQENEALIAAVWGLAHVLVGMLTTKEKTDGSP